MLLSQITRLEAIAWSASAVLLAVMCSNRRMESVLDRIERVCERLESTTTNSGIKQEQHIHQDGELQRRWELIERIARDGQE